MLHWLSVGHANDSLQWAFLACMSGCSFLVWMSIVVTIYSDCSFLIKPWFIAEIHFAWSHFACSICITSFLHTMIILCCFVFRRYLFLWFKSFTDSRVRYEWVLFNYSQLTWSLEFVLGFCHRIVKGEDCKVEFNQPFCWLYFMPICL